MESHKADPRLTAAMKRELKLVEKAERHTPENRKITSIAKRIDKIENEYTKAAAEIEKEISETMVVIDNLEKSTAAYKKAGDYTSFERNKKRLEDAKDKKETLQNKAARLITDILTPEEYKELAGGLFKEYQNDTKRRAAEIGDHIVAIHKIAEAGALDRMIINRALAKLKTTLYHSDYEPAIISCGNSPLRSYADKLAVMSTTAEQVDAILMDNTTVRQLAREIENNN